MGIKTWNRAATRGYNIIIFVENDIIQDIVAPYPHQSLTIEQIKLHPSLQMTSLPVINSKRKQKRENHHPEPPTPRIFLRVAWKHFSGRHTLSVAPPFFATLWRRLPTTYDGNEKIPVTNRNKINTARACHRTLVPSGSVIQGGWLLAGGRFEPR